eukprot:15343513-Ditylum_brightwellii.AAC.1
MLSGVTNSAPTPATQTTAFVPGIFPLVHDNTIALPSTYYGIPDHDNIITSPSAYYGNPDGNIIPCLTDGQEAFAMTAYNQESFRVPPNTKLLPPPEWLIYDN